MIKSGQMKLQIKTRSPFRAKVLGCTNAHWPDIHGHYREAKFTQVLILIWFLLSQRQDTIDSGKHSSMIFTFTFNNIDIIPSSDETPLVVENEPGLPSS